MELFNCPAKGCGSQYALLFRAEPPETPPKCEDCGRPFPASSNGAWLHYQPARPILNLSPDSSV
jgi:hypothetical protein